MARLLPAANEALLVELPVSKTTKIHKPAEKNRCGLLLPLTLFRVKLQRIDGPAKIALQSMAATLLRSAGAVPYSPAFARHRKEAPGGKRTTSRRRFP